MNHPRRVRSVWVGAALAGLCVVVYCACQRLASNELLWGADESGGAPYVFEDPENPEHKLGFEVELAEALSKELDRPIRFQHAEFENIIPSLLHHDFTFAMNGLEIMPERLQQVRFSRPYYVYKLQLAVRAGDKRIASLDDLKAHPDYKVGSLTGSAAARVLSDRGIHSLNKGDQTGLYKDLSSDQLDAVYLDLPIHSYYLPLYPNLRLAGEPGEKGYYAIAFRKEDAALAARFDAALDRLVKTNQLRSIYEKWHIWNDDQRELADIQAPTAAVDPGRGWTFDRYIWLLLDGAAWTVVLSVLGMLLAVLLGMAIALSHLYGPAPARWLTIAYVEFFRGIPVLLLIYFLYYSLSDLTNAIGLGTWAHLGPYTAAVIGLGLNYAAYESEIYRAGIGAVPRGQWEAAASLGMSPGLTFQRIILPQALRVILPPMTSDFVALFKDTSVASIIGVIELSKQYQIASQSSLKYVEIGLVTAALYLIMSLPLGFLSRYLEKRWGQPGG